MNSAVKVHDVFAGVLSKLHVWHGGVSRSYWHPDELIKLMIHVGFLGVGGSLGLSASFIVDKDSATVDHLSRCLCYIWSKLFRCRGVFMWLMAVLVLV